MNPFGKWKEKREASSELRAWVHILDCCTSQDCGFVFYLRTKLSLNYGQFMKPFYIKAEFHYH